MIITLFVLLVVVPHCIGNSRTIRTHCDGCHIRIVKVLYITAIITVTTTTILISYLHAHAGDDFIGGAQI